MTGPAASQDAGDEAGAKRWETKTLTFDNVHVHAVVARALGIDMRHSARLRDGTVPSIPRSIHSHHILGSYIHHYILCAALTRLFYPSNLSPPTKPLTKKHAVFRHLCVFHQSEYAYIRVRE